MNFIFLIEFRFFFSFLLYYGVNTLGADPMKITEEIQGYVNSRFGIQWGESSNL